MKKLFRAVANIFKNKSVSKMMQKNKARFLAVNLSVGNRYV